MNLMKQYVPKPSPSLYVKNKDYQNTKKFFVPKITFLPSYLPQYLCIYESIGCQDHGNFWT